MNTAHTNQNFAFNMARFGDAEQNDDEGTKVEEVIKPPTNLDEFVNVEKLKDWPQRLTSESALDIQNEALLLGSQKDIADILRDAAPLGLYLLDNMQNRLDKLEETLNYYASQIVTGDKRPSRLEDGLFYSPSRTFITEISDSDAVKSHHSSKGHKSLDFLDSVIETRKRSLEYCQFPGFRHGELIELPGQLEAPPILHRVTKAQDFNPGFRKFWKKLFLSEAAVAMMQDTFWWFFLHKFDKNKAIDQNLLFDRIADSYVALFTSINEDVKDKFLAAFPDCLAQAVFSCFWEAFPESRSRFDDAMRQELVNTVCEWTSGVKPVPGTYQKWNISRLQSKVFKGIEKDSANTAERLMHAAAMNKELDYSLDIESFIKMVDKFGFEQANNTMPLGAARDGTRITPLGAAKDGTRITPLGAAKDGTRITPLGAAKDGTRITPLGSTRDGIRTTPLGATRDGIRTTPLGATKDGTHTTPLGTAKDVTRTTPIGATKDVVIFHSPNDASQSRQVTGTEHRHKLPESHQIGPGPTFECVKFNTEGKSPLISQYLHLRKLKDLQQVGMKVRRTEIVKLPPPGPTYRELIRNSLAMTDALSKEYQRICEETEKEIYELEKKQQGTNKAYHQLTKELMFTRNPQDLKMLSDKIIELGEKDRETPLLKDDNKEKDER